MPHHTYYGFKLSDGVKGLKRALSDASIHILSINKTNCGAEFKVVIDGTPGHIVLEYSKTKNHPLAKLGVMSVLDITVTDNLPGIKPVLTMAFLRGGG